MFLKRAKKRDIIAITELGDAKILRNEAFERISYTLKLEDLSDVDFVFKAITENLEAKRNLFSQLEDIVPRDIILATNTSSSTVSEIAKVLSSPERFGAVRFSNPPMPIKLIEIVAGCKTIEETLNFFADVANQIGKNTRATKKGV